MLPPFFFIFTIMKIIGLKSRHLDEGAEYDVTEEIGKILIAKGVAYEKGKEPVKPKRATRKKTQKS